ncbi:hypothetical protein CROQUDRAFT_579371 [Cronartium quercuum f. sp. fusiforme G11]|uniref:Uncharacterized protein n=1 Tax=Cronartium quercuum f. sp. fusiforme G11 TaxID=708437 RepID=A0A9P6TB75_9BASI|nr:hypothetical protein CROQUDRAFT_579371 [Cronartium quercuum f. sp. fusiforme G11]
MYLKLFVTLIIVFYFILESSTYQTPHTTTYACYKQAYRMPITLLEAVTSHLFVSAR